MYRAVVQHPSTGMSVAGCILLHLKELRGVGGSVGLWLTTVASHTTPPRTLPLPPPYLVPTISYGIGRATYHRRPVASLPTQSAQRRGPPLCRATSMRLHVTKRANNILPYLRMPADAW